MQITWTQESGNLTLSIALDRDERLDGAGQNGRPVSLTAGTFTIALGEATAAPHSDVLGLIALTTLRPWVGTELRTNRPVSKDFSDSVAGAFGLRIEPIDNRLDSRTPGSRVGISFGAGADSAAVASVLGKEAPLIHLRRVRHARRPTRSTVFDPEILAGFSRKFSLIGYETHIIDCDVEHIVAPYPSFPTWPGITIGALALADELDLGAVATGTVLGSRYFLGGNSLYTGDHPDRPWEEVFQAIGLPLMMPMAGGTEATTGAVVARQGWQEITRSCTLGTRTSPCWNCAKCFRKELVDAARESRDPNQKLMENVQRGSKVLLEPFANGPPFPLHHMWEYVFARLPQLQESRLGPVMRSIPLSVEETRWVERYYPAAVERIADPWRRSLTPAIHSAVTLMDADDQRAFLSWDADERFGAQSGSLEAR